MLLARWRASGAGLRPPLQQHRRGIRLDVHAQACHTVCMHHLFCGCNTAQSRLAKVTVGYVDHADNTDHIAWQHIALSPVVVHV